MQFSVKNRDGPARIGELAIEHKRITTPNILFVNSSRFKAPKSADILITNDDRKTKKPIIRIGDGTFSSIANEPKGELSISSYLIYPKDVLEELQLFAIKSNEKKKNSCYVIPGNKEIINV